MIVELMPNSRVKAEPMKSVPQEISARVLIVAALVTGGDNNNDTGTRVGTAKRDGWGSPDSLKRQMLVWESVVRRSVRAFGI